jgi:type III secretion system low calcium response chaperone LcrH/SycD
VDKIIDAIQDIYAKPLMAEIKKQYLESAKGEEAQKGALGKTNAILEAEACKDMETFQRWAKGTEDLEKMEMGFDLVLQNLDKLPNKEVILQELRQAGHRLVDISDNSHNDSPMIYDTTLEMFGLSEDTFNGFYVIGSEFFNDGKYEEALNVFLLLTNLDHLVFETWLGLGICWQKKNNPLEALRAFSMASLVNFTHPAPHIHSAEIYLSIGEKELAQETYKMIFSQCNKEQMKNYKAHVHNLKRQLRSSS